VRRVKRLFATLFLLFLVAVVAGGVVFIGEIKHASELMVTLPDKLKQIDAKPTRILSADGQVLYTVESEFREPVKLSDVPEIVRDAILAAEDKRFYQHSGVDYWAMARILVVGAKEGRFSQGGSTLTMQLAKRFYSEGEKTMNRKMQDVALAIEMEREMTKDQILELYLNTMYFGEKAYGIRAAAEVYFGKPLDKLTIAEAAMLARCVRRPSDENPVKNLPKAIENRNVVLGVMRDESMITEDRYQEAIAEKVHLAPPKERITSHLNKAQYFVAHVLATIAQEMPDLDLKQGGYTIYTTLNTKIEDYAEKEVRNFVREHRDYDVNDAAFVLMDKDGKILAEVGGVDFAKDQFNIVTQGLLQPGSSFKPFLYATALSSGALNMGDLLDNQRFTYPGTENSSKPWRPEDSSPREMSGPVSVEKAIALSLNIPAAHVMEKVGPDAVADLAAGAFGFRSKIDRVPSLALGSCMVHPLEMAQGYSVFMLRGSRATPYVITKIVDADGQILKTYDPNIIPNQLDATVCDEIDSLLNAVIQKGTASSTGIDEIPNARGKTGTTSDHKDAWFCGYTDGLVGVGWVGNNVVRKGKAYQLPMARSMWGATTAAGIWKNIMQRAHDLFATPMPGQQERDRNVQRSNERDNPDDTTIKVLPPDDGAPAALGPDGKPIPPTSGPGDADPTGGNVGGAGGAATGTGGDTGPQTSPPGTAGGATNGPPDTPAKPDNAPTRRDQTKHRRSDQGDTVQVEVCAESGMRATIYCPETVVRTFKRGQEPKKYCTIHHG